MARRLSQPESTSQTRLTKAVLIAVLVMIFVVIWVTRMAHNYVYVFLDHYEGTTSVLQEMKGMQRSEDELEALLPLQQAFDDWKQTHLRDRVSVTGADGAELRGGLYDAGSDITVVLLHSFDGSSTASDYLLAPYYAEKGYNILLPDSRDHGESGGEHVTYGLLEGSDTAAWVRWLCQRYGPDHKVILHGYDLGANAALAGAAELQRDPETAGTVAFVAAQSPIADLYDAAVHLLRGQLHAPKLLILLADHYGRESLGGLSTRDVSLADMTAGCTVPILVIRETEDALIDPTAADGFCGSYAGPHATLDLAGAHGMGYAGDSAAYEAALDAMIAACLGGN